MPRKDIKMVKLLYHGGRYDGEVCVLPTKKKGLNTVRLVPHGYGTLVFDDVMYTGYFKRGYEHGCVVMIWSTGETYSGVYAYGWADPSILRTMYQVKRKNKQLMSSRKK